MTWYADMSECNYFGNYAANVLRAVGWLDFAHPYTTGSLDSQVFEKICSFSHDALQPVVACGVHSCNICQFDPPLGHRNLFVPSAGFLYVAPELIVHYIAQHRYLPPPEFCDAVIACADLPAMEYKKRFLANGGRVLMQVPSSNSQASG